MECIGSETKKLKILQQYFVIVQVKLYQYTKKFLSTRIIRCIWQLILQENQLLTFCLRLVKMTDCQIAVQTPVNRINNIQKSSQQALLLNLLTMLNNIRKSTKLITIMKINKTYSKSSGKNLKTFLHKGQSNAK